MCTTIPGTATTGPSIGGGWTHDVPCHACYSCYSTDNTQSVRHEIARCKRAALIPIQVVSGTPRTLQRQATAVAIDPNPHEPEVGH